MSIPYPLKQKGVSAWDKLSLGEIELPGIVTSFNTTTQYIYASPQSKGQNSADVTYQGMNPRLIDASIVIYTEEDWDLFVNGFAKTMVAKITSKETVPLEIRHPQADIWGIKYVYVTDVIIGQPNPVDGYVYTLRLLEHRKPEPVKTSNKTEKNKDIPFSQQDLPPRPGNALI